MKRNMEEIIEKLNLEFYKIQCKNWIPSQGSGTSAAGRTLENLLNKKEDNQILPDYYGIELKTKLENSEPFIGLFSMALDNKPLEMQRLLELGGYPDKTNPEFKAFHISVDGINWKQVRNYFYRLKVNYDKEIIQLEIINYGFHQIESEMSWSFMQLQSRLEHKLSYLAIIPTKKYLKNGILYFKYLNIKYYKLKNFNVFLELIQNGTIRVVFKLSQYKNGEKYGKIHDRGTTFEIEEKNLELLFDIIEL